MLESGLEMDLVTRVQEGFALWQSAPAGLKSRIAQGIERLTGRFTRRWDVADKQEDAELDNTAHRAANEVATQAKILEALVPELAKSISGDPDLMRVALVQTMGEAYRKQSNNEAIIKECIEDLNTKAHDHAATDDDLDKDWLNFFSAFAEKASTERTRRLWGRILSGEIRHPGRFSLSTLRCLAEVDQEIAQKFVAVASLVGSGGIIMAHEDKNRNVDDLVALEGAGLIIGVQSGLATGATVVNNSTVQWWDERFLVNMTLNGGPRFPYILESIPIPWMPLTRAGRELLTTIDYVVDHERRLKYLYDAIPKQHLASFQIHRFWGIIEGRINYDMVPLSTWPLQETASDPGN